MWTIRSLLAVGILSLAVQPASAQFFGAFGGPNWTPYPTYTFGGGMPYNNLGYSAGMGYGPGFYPFYPYYGYMYSTYTVPGWAASGGDYAEAPYVARARSTEFPAVALPASSPLLRVDPLPAGARAELTVSVPNAQAQVWVEGRLTSTQGLVRQFATPSLQVGKDYVYDIVVQWTNRAGQTRTERRSVSIHAGDAVQVAIRE